MKKKVLNIHVGEPEKQHVDQVALAEGITITMVVRNLIRRDMRRAKKSMSDSGAKIHR